MKFIAGVLMLMMFFGMFMFIFFGFGTDPEGKFWFQDSPIRNLSRSPEENLNIQYDKCKDESSSLSLVFFNINTDPVELRQCLRQVEEEWRYGAFYIGYINGFDIPTEFKEIIRDVKRHEIAESKKELELRIAANPSIITEAKFYTARGNTHYGLGEYKLAIQSYDEAISVHPQYVPAYYARGNAYYYLRKGPQMALAIQSYDEAIQLNPQHASAYYNRGNAQLALHRYEEAIQSYDEAIRLNPQYAEAYYYRGVTYEKLGDKSIPEAFNASEYSRNRQLQQLALRRYEEAIQSYDEAIRLNPQYAEAYFNRGVTYYELGQYDQAISDFAEAIRLNPQDADAYLNRGVTYEKLGDESKAEQDFAKYEELRGK